MPPRPSRPRDKRPGRGATMARDVGAAFRADLARIEAGQWPATKWQGDPLGFIREVLHYELLEHQEEIVLAVRDHPNVAVSAGQKVGKSLVIVCIVLWFWSSFPGAKVTLTMTTADQIDAVIWSELRKVVAHAKERGVDLLAGGSTIAEDPSTGMESPDGRVIRGMTARQVETFGGISGENQLQVADEASALEGRMAEAQAGNTMGGGRTLWTGNPTRSEGPFFDAFHRFVKFWKTFQVSSLDIAEKVATSGRRVPGIATVDSIRRLADLWGGEESPFYLVRVLGRFLTIETSKIMSIHMITAAQKRWDTTEGVGVLSLGVDWAGEGQGGDEWAFAPVRGAKVITDIHTERALTVEQAIDRIRGFLRSYRRADEIPRVVVDAEGPTGGRLYNQLGAVLEHVRVYEPRESFVLIGVRASLPAVREPHLYGRIRDELLAGLARWLSVGGAIPGDYKLEAELHAPQWHEAMKGHHGRVAVATKKDKLKAILKRSPDRMDALALAVWQPSIYAESVDAEPVQEAAPEPRDIFDAASAMGDQQEAGDPWWPSE